MINLATIAQKYQEMFEQRYSKKLQAKHYRALKQIIACHTPAAGAMLYHCDDCHEDKTLLPSCGHRHCPACQHKSNSHWLAMQQQKLLPLDYYLATFTLPAQLRPFIWTHQKWAYQAMFMAAKETLNEFFKNDKKLGECNGLVAVLHTHSRKLDFHPHVHFIVPAGGLSKNKMCWHANNSKFLFVADNLAKVFRGKFIAMMKAASYYLPNKTPKEWNADCEYVGKGNEALTYLARYLYRGVISENNILALNNDEVTFQYKPSKSKTFKTITEHACKFLWRIIQHVLPKGFRRARNYGFLHGNAKATLKRLQLQLKVNLPPLQPVIKKPVCCDKCHQPMALYLMRIANRVILGGTR
jgi:hypothetical protein